MIVKSIAYVRDLSPIGIVTPCQFTPQAMRRARKSTMIEPYSCVACSRKDGRVSLRPVPFDRSTIKLMARRR